MSLLCARTIPGTMKTKIILTINGIANELASDCLMNWDEVICACKRTEFSGVVRSFSSKFDFVNAAYDMLLDAYLRDGVRADAAVAICLLNNDWSWRKEFEAALNFSTATWDNCIFSINCIDDSLAALIKSRKGTKYEFEIGKEIFADQSLKYDRIEMLNTVTHGIVGHGTSDGGGTIINHAPVFQRLPTYILNDDEIYAGSPVICHDESDDSGDCFISVSQNVAELDIKTDILIDGTYDIEIHLFEFGNDNPDLNDAYIDWGIVFKYSWQEARRRLFLGIFTNIEALKEAYPIPPANSWAGVGNAPSDIPFSPGYATPYFAPVVDEAEDNEWIAGSNDFYFTQNGIAFDCATQRFIKHFRLRNLTAGKKYALFYKTIVADNVHDKTTYVKIESTIKTQWLGRAKPVAIDAISPLVLLKSLISKITDKKTGLSIDISDHDPRLRKTYLFGAESIRGIKSAKIYSSFNDFCDWMETVFGYVYTIGPDSRSIHFIHRSELFQNQEQGLVFSDAKEPHSKVNNSILYSVIEIGYVKQDYETQCGRDEWNFMNYYNTGIDVIEKKLTLQSKYRADCYGFEFLAQKRNQDTTDNESDGGIFFALCSEVEDVIENQYAPDSRGDGPDSISGVSTHLELSRSCNIQGALTDTVFNGEFSPYYCIKANEGYISAMAPDVTLQFASSDGNSDIVIDGIKATANIPLGERLFSEVELSFVGMDLGQTVDYSKLVKVISKGLVYTGFFIETKCCYARPSEVEYNLIVKSIEPI